MKGYMAFKKGLICTPKGEKPFQCKTIKIYETGSAEPGQAGFKFCESPYETVIFNPFFDENGDKVEYAEIETLDEVLSHDGYIFYTKKIKIIKKLNFEELLQVDFNNNLVKSTKTANKYLEQVSSSADYTQISVSGDFAQISASGDHTRISADAEQVHIGASGDHAQIISSGLHAHIGASGDFSEIISSGYGAQIDVSGDLTLISSNEDKAQIALSGKNPKLVSKGKYARIGSSSFCAQIISSGDCVQIGTSGDFSEIKSTGQRAQIASSGDCAKINSAGEDSVIYCAGCKSVVKAKVGSWITLAEWGEDENGIETPKCVKTKCVDGDRIKADTYYKLIDGKFVECK